MWITYRFVIIPLKLCYSTCPALATLVKVCTRNNHTLLSTLCQQIIVTGECISTEKII